MIEELNGEYAALIALSDAERKAWLDSPVRIRRDYTHYISRGDGYRTTWVNTEMERVPFHLSDELHDRWLKYYAACGQWRPGERPPKNYKAEG
jgi:hypothetical protein